MAISLGNAFKSVKTDEHWLKKTIIGGFICLAATIGDCMMEAKNVSVWVTISGLLIYLLFYVVLLGFMVSTANKKLNNDFSGWTEWAESSIFLKGLKCTFGYLLYTLVLAVIFALIAAILAIVSGIAVGIIVYLINMVLTLEPKLVGYMFMVLLGVIITILGLYFVQFLNAGFLCFCKNLKIRDLMALKKQYRMIVEKQHAAWTLVGKYILLTLATILAIITLVITIVGTVLVPFVLFAVYMTMVDLYIQYDKEIDSGKYLA